MVKADIQAVNLRDFYRQIVAAQQAAHGADYTLHHEVIRQAAKDGARSYAELGVNQGATLACAILAGFGSVEGVDIALVPFRAYEGLFRASARALGTLVSIWEQDSRLPIGEVDFLLIDTRHEPGHLHEELTIHGPHVRRQILIHDTASVPTLHTTATAWAKSSGWTVQHRETRNVGFTLLQKQA